MNRLRPNTRIRPIRPYWSRAKVLTVTAISGLVLFWVATAWLQRSDQQVIELDPTGPYRFQSSAGPIDVTHGDQAVLRYDASWLLSGPNVSALVDGSDRPSGDPAPQSPTTGPESFAPAAATSTTAAPADGGGLGWAALGLDCSSRFPCRAASRLELPPGSDVDVASTEGAVSVAGYAGRLTIATGGRSDVFLGSVGGSLTVSTLTGGVYGFGLTATEVEIDTTSGEIELEFTARPGRLVVRSGSEPVTIRLPDGDYAVSVDSGSSIAITVGQAASADSEIIVQARGPVRIDPTR